MTKLQLDFFKLSLMNKVTVTKEHFPYIIGLDPKVPLQEWKIPVLAQFSWISPSAAAYHGMPPCYSKGPSTL